MRVVVATTKSWNIADYAAWRPRGVEKFLIQDPRSLLRRRLDRIRPRYVFFPHWSWIIPPEIFEEFECVVFHMTDVPFARGGSPLQNLIVRGLYKTRISAIRVVQDLDAGPVYMKRPFDLSRGNAEELYGRASRTVFRMMTEIIHKQPVPSPQRGKAVVFPRRKPEQSRLPPGLRGRSLYDFIRMLDAEGYPRAFIEHSGYRIEFRDAALENRAVSARVLVRKSRQGA